MFIFANRCVPIDMRENNKEILFARTFSLLLTHNIGDLTLDEVEKFTGFTRGAIFYYAKNKMEFFRHVLISQVLEKQDIHNKVNYLEGMSLREFIEAYLDGIIRTRNYYLEPVKGPYPENPTHAYLLLILQIKHYYPDLGERYSAIMEAERQLWKKVLTSAIRTGEINPPSNLDTVAGIFQSLFYGCSFQAAISEDFVPDNLRAQMMEYYGSLCVKAM